MTNNETVWTPWLENPGTGECPVPDWAEEIRSYIRMHREARVLAIQRLRWECIGNGDDITHYRYVVPADLAWLAEHVTRWGGGDRKYVWVQKPGGKAWWHEMYSDGESSVITQYSKDDWLRARRDLGYIAPAERSAEFRRKCAGETPPSNAGKSKYHKSIKGVQIDIYDVLHGFEVTNPGDQHAIKKMLMPGRRGVKDAIKDRREAIASLERAIELEDDG